MLAAIALAACGAWHGMAAGYYAGQVESSGQIQAVETWIERTPQGLAGRYVLKEPGRDVPGTLEPLGDEGCETALFRWTDLYGTGLLRLRFNLPQRCFEGAWGVTAINPALIYTSCARAPVTS